MDLLFHMLIPLMLLLVAGVDRKKALMLAPIAIIPDLDVLFSAHRVYLHTIFIPIAILLIPFLYNLTQKKHPSISISRGKPFLATLYYSSHLILDFFGGPVALFWPLTNLGYGLNIGVTVNQQSVIPTIQLHMSLVIEQIVVPNVVTNAAAATTGSIAVAALFFAVILLTKRIRRLSTEE